MMMRISVAILTLFSVKVSNGFVQSTTQCRQSTSLSMESDRRDMLKNAFGAGALILCGTNRFNGDSVSAEDEGTLLAGLTNPAGGNFRGKFKGQSFTPGKGMRQHEDELIAGLTNPAGGNFRGKFKGQSFTPGKGMRQHEDELIAGLTNPAGGNFRGKFKGQSFTPGKGMRQHEDELIAGLTNPAGGNFRGKFKGQSFTPGKGMRQHESFDAIC